MNILFLSSWFPYPPINGAKIRINNLIRELAKNHDISLFAFARTIPIEDARKHIPVLQEYCKSVDVIPIKTLDSSNSTIYKDLISAVPRSVAQNCGSEVKALIGKRVTTSQCDVVIASEAGLPGPVSFLASEIEGVPKILDALEIGMLKDVPSNQSIAALRRIRLGVTWLKYKNFTKQLLHQADACTVPSLQEQQNMLEVAGGATPVKIVPHGLDLAQYAEPYEAPQPNSLVFSGSFTYSTNADAAFFFLNEIYPQIQERIPDVQMRITGSTTGVDLDEFPTDESVIFTGLVKDVRPVVAQSWLSVVPLRFGSGTRLKIIEAMALGTPVVSTSKGAEGLAVTHGRNILIADDPEDFAMAVVELMKNKDLHQELSDQGRKLVSERYSSEVMARELNSLMGSIVNRNDVGVPAF